MWKWCRVTSAMASGQRPDVEMVSRDLGDGLGHMQMGRENAVRFRVPAPEGGRCRSARHGLGEAHEVHGLDAVAEGVIPARAFGQGDGV